MLGLCHSIYGIFLFLFLDSDTEEGVVKKNVVFHCRLCPLQANTIFHSRRELNRHQVAVHQLQQIGGAEMLQPRPFSEENAIWNNPMYSPQFSNDLRICYEENQALILRPNEYSDIESRITVPMNGNFSIQHTIEAIQHEFNRTGSVFKCNISAGVMLFHQEDQRFRLYLPYCNSAVFDLPVLISDEQDIAFLKEKLEEVDYGGYMLSQRPDTKFIPVAITHVVISCWHMSDVVIGCNNDKLPDFIRRSNAIMISKPSSDNMCFFSALAHFKYPTPYNVKIVKALFNKWSQFCKNNQIKKSGILDDGSFKGMLLSNLFHAEELFKVNIQVFNLSADGTCTSVYRSLNRHEQTMFLNIDDTYSHFFLITNFEMYAKKYRCRGCDHIFNRFSNLTAHQKVCSGLTREKFPGGYFCASSNLFQRIEDLGIEVDESRTFFPYFTFWDIESQLKHHSETVSDSTQFNAVHIPVSVAVASNIPGYESGQVFVNKDPAELMKQFVTALEEMQKFTENKLFIDYKDILTRVLRLYFLWKPEKDDDVDEDEEEGMENEDNGDEATEVNYNEPASKEFLDAISRENPWRAFCQNLEGGTWGTHFNYDLESDPERELCSQTESIMDDSLLEVEPSSSTLQPSSTEDMLPDSAEPEKEKTIFEEFKESCEFTYSTEEKRVVEFCCPKIRKSMFNRISKVYDDLVLWLSQLCCISYNGSSYDINVCKKTLFPLLNISHSSIIKKGSQYKMVATRKFKFLDALHFCSAGTTFRNFVRCWAPESDLKKIYFPYPALADLTNLNNTSLPPVDSQLWINDLNGKHLLEDSGSGQTIEQNFEDMCKIWKEQNMETLEQFLAYYNICDVVPGVVAFSNLAKLFRNKKVDVLRNCISAPGAARQLLFAQAQKENCHFGLFNERDKDLKEKIDRNIAGGQSIIFRRENIAGQTPMLRSDVQKVHSGELKISDMDKTKLLHHVEGFDATGLYGYCLSSELPTGMYIRRDKENKFKPIIRERYELQFQYFNFLNSKGHNIKHKQNMGKEMFTGPYKIDGQEGNKLFEVLGCHFHLHHPESCPANKSKAKNEEWMKKSEMEQEKIQKRIEHLELMNYEVRIVWECELRHLYKTDAEFRYYVDNHRPTFYQKFKGECSEADILEGVRSGKLYGLVECSIKLGDTWPENMQNKPSESPAEFFFDWPAIYGNGTITEEHYSPLMREFAQKNNISTKPRDLLISSNSSENCLYATPYLQQLMELGYTVHSVNTVVEYSSGKKPFKKLIDEYSSLRREADSDKSRAVVGSLAKLLGNSSYGSLLIRSDTFRNVKFKRGLNRASQEINNKRFLRMCTINEEEEFYEFESLKASISYKIPMVLAFFVLQLAKKRVNEFVYYFLKKYFKPGSYYFILSDTDSIWCGFNAPLEECIREDMKEEYNFYLYGFCTPNEISIDKHHFLFRKCCDSCFRYDHRVNGRFHSEFYGDYVIGLCSKCYYAANRQNEDVKFSCKGVQKALVDRSGKEYASVFYKQQNVKMKNRGFVFKRDSIFTYVQEKSALNFFYVKRFIDRNASTSAPLNIPIKPKKAKSKGPLPINADLTTTT